MPRNRYPRLDEYPKTLKVSGKIWRIEFTDHAIFYGRTECIGITDPDGRVVMIDESFTLRDVYRTFIHELFHVVEAEYRIPIPHALIYKLEKPVARFVLDNFFRR